MRVRLLNLSVFYFTGQENFDPTNRKFSTEELKPQPIIKKSKKVCVLLFILQTQSDCVCIFLLLNESCNLAFSFGRYKEQFCLVTFKQ